MDTKESNNISSSQTNNTSHSLSLTLFLFFSLILFCFVLLIYWNVIVGALFIVVPTAYYFIKKYFSTKQVDELIKQIFHAKKSILVFSIILYLISLIIITINEFDIFSKGQQVKNKNFSGIVWDEMNEPLTGVILFLPELNFYDTTDSQGRFSFIISDTTLTLVSFIAQKDGYRIYEADGSVGNPNYNFNMIKK